MRAYPATINETTGNASIEFRGKRDGSLEPCLAQRVGYLVCNLEARLKTTLHASSSRSAKSLCAYMVLNVFLFHAYTITIVTLPSNIHSVRSREFVLSEIL